MKTASEVARKFIDDSGIEFEHPDTPTTLVEDLTKALTAFRAEGIRHAVIESFEPEYRKIRDEALEEAAFLIDCHHGPEDHGCCERRQFAKAILALNIKI